MKIKEIKELETKDLAERIKEEVAKYNQMKLNHAITPLENPSLIKAARRDIENLTNNNGPDGNKKFKKDKTGCRYQQQNG